MKFKPNYQTKPGEIKKSQETEALALELVCEDRGHKISWDEKECHCGKIKYEE